MKLEIDWTRCDGHGLCASCCPNESPWTNGDSPSSADTDVAPRDERNIRRAVALCPALALRLENR